MKSLLLSALCALFSCAASAQTPDQLFAAPNVRRALDYLKATEAETLSDQIKACEIPAPTFQEEQRAAWFKQRFTELGLKNVRIDRIGNVIGERPGAGGGPVLVLAAHLDTVFPAGTDVRVKRDGTMLSAPGIGDDSRGLGVIVGVARALNEAKIETAGTILFVANVGEEGLGDLRGVRHLFNEELKGRATHFISVDGTGLGITNTAVGVVRYRVTLHGPGGHSYGAFGLPSPIHALGRAIEKIARFQVPQAPKTTFNVGKIEGGTSVNSIAHTAWMEVDMRSESAAELNKLEAEFKRAVQAALDEENERGTGDKKLMAELKIVSQRPAGVTPADAPIVQIARAADRALGLTTKLSSGSTDSNIPISLGIPAITIDGGGQGFGAHALDERFDTTNSHLGTQRALLIALGIVGVR
ncbi:MAG: M20/M25/M40 family metallo-hydrolase [Acidobacteria bacterium]|nr:M20/M25/M40 family metallo-hydrolase [Acidobacteriota bacterium]MBI3421857.1 M20/M25/M40 family metallo-hydrolase [Acidobacteriota bacterium]